MRVNADRKPAFRPGRENGLGPRDLGIVFGGEDDERTRHTGRARPLNDCRQVGDELLAGNMTVTIDHDLPAAGLEARIPAGDPDLVAAAKVGILRFAVRVLGGGFVRFLVVGANLHELALKAACLAL